MIQNKYYSSSIYSPYKIDLLQVRNKSIEKTQFQMANKEKYDRKERFISTQNYLKEVEESFSHDDKLVKKDYFSIWDKSLRILAV